MIAKHLVHMHGSRRSSAWPHNFFKSFPLVCRRAFQIFSLFHWFAGVHSKFWEPLPYCIGFQSGAAPSSIISWHFQIKPTLAAISVNADATENMCLFVHNNRNHIMDSFRRMPLWHQPMSKIHQFPKHFCRVRIIDIQQLWIFQLWRQVVLHTTRGLGTCHGARLDVSGRLALGFASLLVAKLALMQNPLGIWQS